MSDIVQAPQPSLLTPPQVESAHLRLEEILERAFESNHSHIQIAGTSSALPLGFLLASSHSRSINHLPHLVIVADDKKAQEFKDIIEFFDPSRRCIVNLSFDVSPYSGLYSQPRVIGSRLGFIHAAQGARAGDIFITSLPALTQQTLPFQVFNSLSQTLKPGDDLPSSFAEILSSLGYKAAPLVEDCGQFAIRGGIVDIFSPSAPQPVRIELFGDQIESLRFFDPLTQRSGKETSVCHLIPAQEVLYTDSEYEKTVQRLQSAPYYLTDYWVSRAIAGTHWLGLDCWHTG